MCEANSARTSLRELAQRAHIDTATAYRLVRRLTGRRWSELQRTGVATVVLQFKRRCRAYTADDEPRAQAVWRRPPVAAPPRFQPCAAPPHQRTPRRPPPHPVPQLAFLPAVFR